jgi:hypothetical protein
MKQYNSVSQQQELQLEKPAVTAEPAAVVRRQQLRDDLISKYSHR